MQVSAISLDMMFIMLLLTLYARGIYDFCDVSYVSWCIRIWYVLHCLL